MYACANRAMDTIRETPNLGSYLPAIVIMTDGRSEGDKPGFYSRWKAIEPHVPVFGITFGDADKTQLDELAKATSARVFDGASDLAGAFRAVRGYN
jgi:Ca-activated chloride channel family protein